MSITYWPKHDEDNTEAAFAQYTDRLFGYADHASSDTAFMAQWTSAAGGNDTYTIAAGSYMFNGYLFTADGTETLVVDDGTSTDCYLSYIKVDATGVINECGIYTASGRPTAGTGETRYDLLLWNFNTLVITDYRQIFTWGRSSYANTDADCIDFLSTRETALKDGSSSYATGSTLKQFRVAYPGTVYLTADIYCASASLGVDVYIYRGSVGTKFADWTAASEDTWDTTKYATVTGLQVGDLISIQGDSGAGAQYKARNFRIRYKLTNLPTPEMVVV